VYGLIEGPYCDLAQLGTATTEVLVPQHSEDLLDHCEKPLRQLGWMPYSS